MGLRAVTVVAVCAALAAGCSSDPQLPSTLPALTGDPSAVPTVSPLPSAISAPTPQGATEFARYFYAQVSEGFQRQDPSLVSRLSLPSCKTCANYVASINTVKEQGLKVEGGEFELFLAVSPAQEDPSQARVDVGWNFRRVVYKDSSGAIVDEGEPVQGVEEQVDLVRDGGQWRVKNITRVRQAK